MITLAVLLSFTVGFLCAHAQIALLERPDHVARVQQRDARKREAQK